MFIKIQQRRAVLIAVMVGWQLTPGISDAEPISQQALTMGATATSPKKKATAEPSNVLDLQQLLDRAKKHYPGIRAAHYAIGAMEQQLFRARYAMAPQGQIRGLVAPSPSIDCLDATGAPSEDQCVQTTAANISSFSFAGIFARVELKLGMPLWTFDKLGSVKRAARAGVMAEKARLEAATADLELNVIRAYWGLKLAREIIYVVKNGQKKLDSETKRVKKQLDEEEGEVTTTDLKRLQTFSAVVESRILDAVKLQRIAKASLARLVGIPSKALVVDKKIIEVERGKLRPLASYLKMARDSRPEAKLLDAAVLAQTAAESLEAARFFPNLLLVASATAAVATGVDDPPNAFYNDPFNVLGAGVGIALTWTIDPVGQLGKYRHAVASSKRVHAKRQEALLGIDLEIEKTFIELQNAQARLRATEKGRRRARSWLVAITQGLAAGLGKPKDLTDVLPTYFELQLKYLQAVFDVNVGWGKLGRAIGKGRTEVAQSKH